VSRLTLAGGRVLDPGQGIDGPTDVVVDDGVIAGTSAAPGAFGDAEASAGQAEVVERLIVPRLVLRAGRLRHIDSPVPGSVAAGSHVGGSHAAGPAAAGSRDSGPAAATGQ
jgi:hypothetical protein